MPTYNPNIPQASQLIKNSQAPIQSNFGAIANLVAVNHIGFNLINSGKHFFVEFPAATPTTSTTLGEVALYSMNGPVSTVPELFFQRQSLAANSGYSITEATYANQGWTRLPSQILVKWGTFTAPHNAQTQFTFPTGGGIPAFASTPYNIQLTFSGTTSSHTGGIFLVSIDSTTQFTIYSDSGNNKIFYYLAIGQG